MTSVFAPHRLGRPDPKVDIAIRRCFALVSQVHPGLPFSDWAAVARHYSQRAPQRAGLVMIEDQRGYAHAVFRYGVDLMPSLFRTGRPEPEGGVLRVSDLVMASLAGCAVLRAVEQAVMEIASSCGCKVIRVDAERLRDEAATQVFAPWEAAVAAF